VEAYTLAEALVPFVKSEFLTECWFKYAQKAGKKSPEILFDFIMENKIGWPFYTTYVRIAEFFEKRMDLRRADKIFRQGLERLTEDKQLRNLQVKYDLFESRTKEKLEEVNLA
jgi:hypothetical protein